VRRADGNSSDSERGRDGDAKNGSQTSEERDPYVTNGAAMGPDGKIETKKVLERFHSPSLKQAKRRIHRSLMRRTSPLITTPSLTRAPCDTMSFVP
jgi:hypothetical protein